jgi:hypothetical protein
MPLTRQTSGGTTGADLRVTVVVVNTRRLGSAVLVAAAAVTVTITAGGSAYAGGNPAPVVSPAPVMSGSDMQDQEFGGCHSHRGLVTDQPDSIKG